MKPTLPEDRELEQLGSEVSGRYRAAADDEPPARLDAAILEAARREVQPRRQRRNWQVPASIAAMLVIGVSLVLIVRDNEPPLSTLERPAAEEAKLARPAPPQLAMKAQPKAKADSYREARPSRERSARPDREPAARDEMADAKKNLAEGKVAGEYAEKENPASGMAAPPVPAPSSAVAPPAVPAPAEPAKSAQQEQDRVAESSEALPANRAKSAADAVAQPRANVQALRKENSSSQPARAQDWLAKIDDLLQEGKEVEARQQLLEFRKQFPQYPLVERLQALLPADQR